MKKIALILFALISVAYAQVGRFPYQTIQQPYKGDTVSTTIKGDSVAFTTSESKFSFNKDVYVKGVKLGGTPSLGLSDLTDVTTATPTQSNFLMANGSSWYSVSFADSVAAYASTGVNKIPAYFVSESGTDCGTCGSRENPFRTPEYAVGIQDVTDSITITTSTGSAICTGISDAHYALLKVGQTISSTVIAIPYGTIIISLNGGGTNAKSITLSNVLNNNGVVPETTVWTPVTINVYGNHTIASNLARDGVRWDFTDANIVWGNLTLFNITVLYKNDVSILGGSFNGTHANSVFLKETVSQNVSNYFRIRPNKITSQTTAYLMDTQGANGCNIEIKANYIKATLGKLLQTGTGAGVYNIIWDVTYSYHLTGYGLYIQAKDFVCNGVIECPASVYNVYIDGTNTYIRGTLYGGFYIASFTVCTIEGLIQGSGTNYVIGNGSFYYNVGQTQGNLNFFGGACTANLNGYIVGNVTVANNVVGTFNNKLFIIGNLALDCINNPKQTNFNNYRYQYAMQINITGGTFNNYAYIKGASGFVSLLASTAIFNNYRHVLSETGSPVFLVDGTYTDNNSITETTVDNSSFVALVKDAGLYISNNGTLRVYNNLNSPIKCSANTTASKKVVYRGLTTNCDGSTFGALLPATGGYAPVPIINNNLNESTTYTW